MSHLHDDFDVNIKNYTSGDITISPHKITAAQLHVENEDRLKGTLSIPITVAISGSPDKSVKIEGANVEISYETHAYAHEFNKTVTIIPNEELTELLKNHKEAQKAAREAYLQTEEGRRETAGEKARTLEFFAQLSKLRNERLAELANKERKKSSGCTIAGGTRRRKIKRRSNRRTRKSTRS
jgi:hypothetical protein